MDCLRHNSACEPALERFMREFPPSVRAVRFGVFEVDLRAGELRKKGIKIRLQGQPFLLLITLLKQRGEVVTREEVRRLLWPEDTFVDFDHSLGTAINKLRDALGDSAANPRFIETLPRRGYRFITAVEEVDLNEGVPRVSEAPAKAPAPTTEPRREVTQPAPVDASEVADAGGRSRWPLIWKMSGIALLLVSLGAFITWRLHSGIVPPVIRSLAVLPLANLSGDPSQDYFSDGMTDELITELGQISDLRVISRSSVMMYKVTRKPLPQIARELNVDGVVEGTVLRAGDRVRITAQLIEASSDRHLWAQSYEGELRNTLALQNEVARAVADQIRIKLSSQEQIALKRVRNVNAEAYEAYLKGRFFWNKRTGEGLRKAVEYFNEAIDKDPNYAQAYSGLADSYALMGDWEYGILSPKEAFPKARAAATKALVLDNSLGEAHTSLAFSLDLFDWDWDSAEREYTRALQLSPGYATAHQWYASHLAVLGRNEEAIVELKKAASLDPLSLIISADTADILLVAHRFDESIKESGKTIEMDPRFPVAHFQLGQAYAQKRNFERSIEEIQKAIGFSGGNITFTSNLAYIYAMSGEKKKAMDLLAGLMNPSGHGFSNASEIALVYVGLGDNDQAMIWLEKGFDQRFNPSILRRPCFDPLRSDPRFQDLMRRIGLQ
jgi:TolB-like protein/DNA-binding winged helix-turn-helix (wHTH) protein/Flp pilus assembly protein TadD